MTIKEADDKKSHIVTLEALAVRRDVNPDVRKRIEQEIRNMRAGIKGEEEAAYEIDFHFGTTKNYAVTEPATEERKPRKKLICATCAQPVELKVARFCWFNKVRFGENIYCRECQQAV